MVRAQIQLTEDEARALRCLAAERSTSIAALVRAAVDELLAAQPGAPGAEVRRRAIAAAGRFRAAEADLSERYGDHLAR